MSVLCALVFFPPNWALPKFHYRKSNEITEFQYGSTKVTDQQDKSMMADVTESAISCVVPFSLFLSGSFSLLEQWKPCWFGLSDD